MTEQKRTTCERCGRPLTQSDIESGETLCAECEFDIPDENAFVRCCEW
jgi:uncharacterized Zn finger protein (UPF0148 family)